MERFTAIVVVLATVFGFRVLGRSWFHPAAVAGLIGVWLLVGPLLAPGFLLDGYGGVVYLIACTALFGSAAILGSSRPCVRRAGKRVPYTALRWLCLAGSVAVLAVVMLTLAGRTGPRSASDVARIARDVSLARYEGSGATSVQSALLAIHYAASMAAPWLRSAKGLDRYLRYEPVLIVPMAVLTTARAGLLYTACLWGASYCCMRMCEGRLGTSFGPRFVLGLGVAVPLTVYGWYQISLVRYSGALEATSAAVSRARNGLGVYAFGHLNAFSSWFATMRDSELTWGRATLNSVSRLLGGDRVGAGGHQESVLVTTAGGYSNIFTSHRELIQDFGVVGALIVAVILGLLAGRVWATQGVGPSYRSLLIIPITAYVLFQPVISIFAYTNVLVALLIFIGTMYVGFARSENALMPVESANDERTLRHMRMDA